MTKTQQWDIWKGLPRGPGISAEANKTEPFSHTKGWAEQPTGNPHKGPRAWHWARDRKKATAESCEKWKGWAGVPQPELCRPEDKLCQLGAHRAGLSFRDVNCFAFNIIESFWTRGCKMGQRRNGALSSKGGKNGLLVLGLITGTINSWTWGKLGWQPWGGAVPSCDWDDVYLTAQTAREPVRVTSAVWGRPH